MIENIIASIIAAFIVAVFAAMYRYTWVGAFIDLVFVSIGYSALRRKSGSPTTIKDFRKRLLRLLISDQSLVGFHKGQFGKSASHAESKKWQTQGTKENMSLKPRMYLTFWPILMLLRHGCAKRSVSLAQASIYNLYQNKRIYVAQSASPNMSPVREPVIVSYRHSMAGALILSVAEPWNEITRSVVDAMLDPKNAWQKNDGGWRQVADDFNSSDLWASAYATKLLDKCLAANSPFSSEERSRAKDLISSTLEFIEARWNKKHWSFGKLTSEEAAPTLYIDIVEILKKFKPELDNECRLVFLSWLSLGGDLSDTYRQILSDIPVEQLYARMAYTFYLGEPHSKVWKVLFERLAQGDLSKLLSSDIAFAIDMSYGYTEDANKKIQPTSFVGG